MTLVHCKLWLLNPSELGPDQFNATTQYSLKKCPAIVWLKLER
jgi:hypothetical protein